MKRQRRLDQSNSDKLPRLPSWVTASRAETLEDVAFLSGAVLGHLHLVLRLEDTPHALLRDRLALKAAEANVMLSGRPERASDLRDAMCHLRPGDHPGPAGEVYQTWRRAVARSVSVGGLHRALPAVEPEQIAAWLDGNQARGEGQGGPVARAAGVIEQVLTETSRRETAALISGDAALALALGWDRVVPLMASGLSSRDLRKDGDELRLACHRAIISSGLEAVRTASDLTRRTARLMSVAPKLRAKGAGKAVVIFLTRDAVSPTALTKHLRSDRAARRFCDRLVDLGVARELTGRDTFRLYGV